MCAKATTDGAGGCGAGVIPSRVWFGAPATGGWLGAFEGVVAELLTVEALCVLVEVKSSLQFVGG